MTIRVHWNNRVLACTPAEGGKLTLSVTSGDQLTVDAILVAAGRKSNVEKLNLSSAGVTASDRGLISVDDDFRTQVPNIYAAGDVIGFPALASTSMQQARIAMRHSLRLGINNLLDKHSIVGVSPALASSAPSPNDILTMLPARGVSLTVTFGDAPAH